MFQAITRIVIPNIKASTFCVTICFILYLFSFQPCCWSGVYSYETADRSIFDESGIGYTDSHIDNRIECTELGNSGKTYVQMKSEPTGGASSPESSAETSGGPDDCAGCGRLIQVNGHKHIQKF